MSMLAMFDAFTCIDDYVHSRKDPLRAREGSELRKHATTSGRGARTGSERLPIMQKTKTQSWRNTALDDYRLHTWSKDHSKGLARHAGQDTTSEYIRFNFHKRLESYSGKRLTSKRRILDYLLAHSLPVFK